jgi:hypothetical protein
MEIYAPTNGFNEKILEPILKKNKDISIITDRGEEFYIPVWMHKRGKFTPEYSDGETVYPLNKDGGPETVKFKDIQIVKESVINEDRVRIKRKYGTKGELKTNKNAPLRNSILNQFGKGVVSEEDLQSILTKVEEDLGKSYDKKKWFRNNKRYFARIRTNEGYGWVLSKYGKRVYDSIQNPDKRMVVENDKTNKTTEVIEDSATTKSIFRKFDEFVSENNPSATTGSINGMGNTALPGPDGEPGSGDIPHQLTGDVGPTADVE